MHAQAFAAAKDAQIEKLQREVMAMQKLCAELRGELGCTLRPCMMCASTHLASQGELAELKRCSDSNACPELASCA